MADAMAAPSQQHNHQLHMLCPSAQPLHFFLRTPLTFCIYPSSRAWFVFCRYCGKRSRKDNIARHCDRLHRKDAALLKLNQVPTHKAWADDWHDRVTHADPVWVNVEDDESSVASDRIRDREMPDDDGSSGMEDEQSEQEDPNAGAAEDVLADDDEEVIEE